MNESLCQPDYLIEHQNIENFSVDKLMLSFVNKLATAVTKADKQYSVMNSDSQAESLIEVLSLQATTQSKIRLIADNLVSFVVCLFGLLRISSAESTTLFIPNRR